MLLKILAPKMMKGITIQECIRKKRTERLDHAGKDKKVVEEKAAESEGGDDSSEQSPLKRMRKTVAKLAKTLLFYELELKPESELEASPTHSPASPASNPPEPTVSSP